MSHFDVNIKYNGKLNPYERDKYTKAGKFKKAVMQDSKVVDFRKLVKNAFERKISAEKINSHFPLSGDVYLRITLYTRATLSLIDTAKAAMDALNKIAYADDRQVKAIQIEIKRVRQNITEVLIEIYDVNSKANNCGSPTVTFSAINVPTIKNVFPLRRTVEFEADINFANEKYIKILKKIISSQYQDKLLDGKLDISFNFIFNNANYHRRDIDNVTLCFITALEGIVILDRKKIAKLTIKSKIRNCSLEEARIGINSITRRASV